jgi:uncharacterized membrane protein
MKMVHQLVEYIIFALNSFSVVILLFGVGKAMSISKKNNYVKMYLGSYVLLSLEVLIASDIIETILNPSIEDILILAGVVVIRTAISYFLGKEMESTEI